MVAPNVIEIPASSAAPPPGPDIYAATLVVNVTGLHANFATLEAALAALPAVSGGLGGKIFLREGVLTPPVGGYPLPAVPVEIVGAGSGWDGAAATTIDATAFGAGDLFINSDKKKRTMRDFNVLGDPTVVQRFYRNDQGSGERADFENILVKNMQTCFGYTQPFDVRLSKFEHRPALGFPAQFWTFLGGFGGTKRIYADQVTVTGATIDDNPFIYATNSEFTLVQGAGPFVNNIGLIRAAVCDFAGEIALLTGGKFVGCDFTPGIFGTPPPRYIDAAAGRLIVTGCSFTFAVNEHIRISGSCRATIDGTDFNGQTAFAQTRCLNVTASEGFGMSDCTFRGCDTDLVKINAGTIDVQIVGCDFVDDHTASRAIDIDTGAFRGSITGNSFEFFDTEAILMGGARWMVSSNTGCKVREVGGANINRYSNNDGLDPSLIIGGASLIENEQVLGPIGVDTTLDEFMRTVLVTAAGGNRTETLPTAASAKWRKYTIKKTDATANTVTIDADGAETIDGALTVVLTAQWQSVTVQSDGTAWFIV